MIASPPAQSPSRTPSPLTLLPHHCQSSLTPCPASALASPQPSPKPPLSVLVTASASQLLLPALPPHSSPLLSLPPAPWLSSRPTSSWKVYDHFFPQPLATGYPPPRRSFSSLTNCSCFQPSFYGDFWAIPRQSITPRHKLPWYFILTPLPALTVLSCISLHICSCHMVSISTTDTLHDWLLCLANLAQGKVTINNYGLNEWNETVMFGNGLQINSSPIFAFSLVSVRWKQKSQMLEFFFKKTVSVFKLFLLLKNWVWIMWIIASVLHQVLTMETWRCSLQIYFLPSFWLVYY